MLKCDLAETIRHPSPSLQAVDAPQHGQRPWDCRLNDAQRNRIFVMHVV